MRLGHRFSVDLDFFSETDEIHERTRQELIHVFSVRHAQVIENVDGDLLMLVNGLHVGFYSYGYPLLEPVQNLENVVLASLLDLGLMKLDAVIGRGSRKDFYDLHIISGQIPLADLLNAGERKYPQVRDFPLMALEGLLQFDNADHDLQPAMLADLPWEKVRQFFVEQGKLLGGLVPPLVAYRDALKGALNEKCYHFLIDLSTNAGRLQPIHFSGWESQVGAETGR